MKSNGRTTGVSANSNPVGRPPRERGTSDIPSQSAMTTRFRKLLADQRKRLTDMLTAIVPGNTCPPANEREAVKLIDLTRAAIDKIEREMDV